MSLDSVAAIGPSALPRPMPPSHHTNTPTMTTNSPTRAENHRVRPYPVSPRGQHSTPVEGSIAEPAGPGLEFEDAGWFEDEWGPNLRVCYLCNAKGPRRIDCVCSLYMPAKMWSQHPDKTKRRFYCKVALVPSFCSQYCRICFDQIEHATLYYYEQGARKCYVLVISAPPL